MGEKKRDRDDDDNGGTPVVIGPAVLGSVVSLKSGGLQLTVTSVAGDNLTATGISSTGTISTITLPRALFRVHQV